MGHNCRDVAHCEDLLSSYAAARDTEKEAIRTELLRFINRGVYVVKGATGADRSYRVHDIVEQNGQFQVVYSHNPTGEQKRMALLCAVELVHDKTRCRMVYSDAAA